MIKGNITQHVAEVFHQAVSENLLGEDFSWDVWPSIDGRGYVMNFVVAIASPIVGQHIGLTAFADNPFGVSDDTLQEFARELCENILKERSRQLGSFAKEQHPASGLTIPGQ